MTKIPRMIPMAEIMKKLANMKKPMNMKKPLIANRSGANLTLGTRPFIMPARGDCQQILRTVKFVRAATRRGHPRAPACAGMPRA